MMKQELKVKEPEGVIVFMTHIPDTVKTSEQAKAVLKIRFEKEINEYFDQHPDLFRNRE
jgi:hypothetical protein